MLVLLRNKARDSGEAGSCAPEEPGEVGLEAAPAAWRDVLYSRRRRLPGHAGGAAEEGQPPAG